MNILRIVLFICVMTSSFVYADGLSTNAVKSKAVFITAAGEITGPYNYNIYNRLNKLYSEGLFSNLTYHESTGADEYKPQIEKFIENGYTIVVGASMFIKDVFTEEAKNHPNVTFILVDVDTSNEQKIKNLYEISFNQEQVSFLVGAIAGLFVSDYNQTLPNIESKKIGIIQALETPAISTMSNSFKNGVSYVCSDCEVVVQDIGSFTDAHKGYEIATQMYNDNISIIMPITGTAVTGVIKASKEQRGYIIGINVDMHLTSSTIIFSIVKNMGIAVGSTLRDILKTPNKVPHHKTYDFYNGGVELSPFYDYDKLIQKSMQDRIKDLKDNLQSEIIQ